MDLKYIYSLFLKSSGISTDTRSLKKNQLFFALKGNAFDGNKYALKAIEKGASYAIIDDPKIKHENAIYVKNTLIALQKLATHHRLKLNIPIIALTGSNGKTTTKELIYNVLNTKFKCDATIGNFNNHIGVPLTLLSFNNETEIGIIEMGANHLNEINQLCEIAFPNFGYITNIGKAHLEGFGSEENILIGKTELYRFIKNNNGKLFANSDYEILKEHTKNIETIHFSNFSKDHYQITFVKANPFVSISCQEITITSNLIGEYNYTNIAASIAIGLYFNVPIQKIKSAIENYTPKNNRSELLKTKNNDIILDAYNANPSSMEAAIANFEKSSPKGNSKKVVILGDMFELGNYSKTEHQKVIDRLVDSSIDKIFLVGANFYNCYTNSEKIKLITDTESLIHLLKEEKIKNKFILIKGSRGMKLEGITNYL